MRYIVLSDIHANWPALAEVLRAAERYGRNGNGLQFCCLGDVVGYGPLSNPLSDPLYNPTGVPESSVLKCIQWLRTSGAARLWFPGNHDEWIVRQQGRIADEGTITLLSQRLYLQRTAPGDWEWYKNRVEELLGLYDGDRDNLNLLTHEPEDASGLALVMTHGKAEPGMQVGMYALPWLRSVLQTSLENVSRANPGKTAIWLYGHTHLPVCARLEQGQVRFCSIKYGQPIPLKGVVGINPGSVGQPRDGDTRASFAVIDSTARTVEFRRVEYDTEAVALELQRESNPLGKNHPLLIEGGNPPRRDINAVLEFLKKQYPEKNEAQVREVWKRAYDELIHRVKTADGKGNMADYQSKVYRHPLHDLEAVEQPDNGF